MNLIQKCPHIIESFACILEIFAVIFLLSMNSLISLEYVQLQRCQSRFNLYNSHTKLSNE